MHLAQRFGFFALCCFCGARNAKHSTEIAAKNRTICSKRLPFCERFRPLLLFFGKVLHTHLQRGESMINTVFAAMITAGFCAAVLLGRTELLGQALLQSGAEAVAQLLQLCGAVVLWSGVMNIAKQAGICNALAKLFAPLTKRLYPGLAEKSKETVALITASFTANLLGLGAAATPPALAAMQQLDKLNGRGETASRDMVMLAVFNCCSVALIPSTVAVLRSEAGSKAPMEILPAVWLASVVSVAAAVLAVKLMCPKEERSGR